LDGTGFAGEIDHLLHLHDWEVTLAQYNLLSSHDEPRFLTMMRGDTRRLRLATLFQMTFPGVPSVYYGDEIGMEGGPEPDCRRAFPWDERQWDGALRQDFRCFIGLRKAHRSLRRGTYTELAVSGGAYVFARQDADETVVVALNVADEAVDLTLDLSTLPNGSHVDVAVFADAWSGREVHAEDGQLAIHVPALDGRVLIC
jgi:glycosidase